MDFAGEFVLLNVSNITMCLDVPWSRAREFEAVEIYQFVHRGENQVCLRDFLS